MVGLIATMVVSGLFGIMLAWIFGPSRKEHQNPGVIASGEDQKLGVAVGETGKIGEMIGEKLYHRWIPVRNYILFALGVWAAIAIYYAIMGDLTTGGWSGIPKHASAEERARIEMRKITHPHPAGATPGSEIFHGLGDQPPPPRLVPLSAEDRFEEEVKKLETTNRSAAEFLRRQGPPSMLRLKETSGRGAEIPKAPPMPGLSKDR